jgi:hypothetical protein
MGALFSDMMCGGVMPPTSKRADFIIPHCNGQAFCLFIIFCALSKKGHQINLLAVEEDARAFHFDIRDQDSGQWLEQGDELRDLSEIIVTKSKRPRPVFLRSHIHSW